METILKPPRITSRIIEPLSWVMIGATALSLSGCSPANLVAQGIERELPKYIGPADHYDVQITGLDLSDNSAESVLAIGERVRPEGAPVIDQLMLRLEGVQYDKAADKLSQVGSARLNAIIKTADLVTFLEAYRNVRSANVVLRSPNSATLSIRPQLGDFALPAGITVEVSGQLVGQGTQLTFEVNKVTAAGIDVSSMTASRLSDLINPLADLRGLPIEVNITDVRVAGDTIGLEVVGSPGSFSL